MTDMDVSLRVRLQNQVSRESDEIKKDLNELADAAKKLGKSGGGDALAKDLAKIGRNADDAKAKLGGIAREASDCRLAIARIGEGFGNFKADATDAAAALGKIKQEAAEVKAAIGRVDDGAFAGLKGDAAAAKQAVSDIGAAADRTHEKIKQMRAGYSTMTTPGGRLVADGSWRSPGALGSAAEGAIDQFGVPLAIGAGGAYLAGALPAGLAVAGGAAVNAAAGDEFRSDQLRVTGQYSPTDQAEYDRMLAAIGARRGVGMSGAQSVFAGLQAGGLSSGDAASMADNALVFSKATQAAPEDAANLTIALRNNMGIPADKMMDAYDSIALGGKEGQFEVPDMARYFPELAALMQGVGDDGPGGVNLLTAMLQSARQNTGTPSDAATNIKGMLGKFLSADFDGKAKEVGLDPEAIIKGAQGKGQQPVIAMLEAIKGKVGTDAFKLKQLMPDQESGAGLVSSVLNLDEIKAAMKRMEAGKGTVVGDYELASDNLNSQKDRLGSNFAQNAKDLVAPILPMLKAAAEAMSQQMEKAREQQKNDPLANVPGAGTITEGIKALLSVSSGSAEKPSALKRFMFGAAAEPDFKLQDHVGINLRPTAEQSMGGYTEGLATEGEKAAQEAQSIADRIKALLGFTVSPTISPTYVAPAGAPSPASAASGKQSSLQAPGNVRITQNISSPNAKSAAMRAQREQARSIRQAQARTLYDTGRRLA